MKARIEMALVKVTNPQVVQVLFFLLALTLMVLSNTEIALAQPTSGSGGCSGG